MNFVQVEFPIFLLLVLAAYWALRERSWQNRLLVVASGTFYGWVHPWFLLLLYGSAVLDFAMAQAIERFPKNKGWFLAASMSGNLGLLGYFKYFGFFAGNWVTALSAMGFEVHPATLGVMLPVGISFYTFQTMGYTVDVYRGELKARSNFVDYLLYVSFFPQLVAGPIERAGRLLPQIESPRVWDLQRTRSGLDLALWGGFKKVVIADTLAPYVDKVYILEDPAGPLLWAATAAFMIQIYADFSGYTDIARGTARMLGFDLQENFNEPFVARTTVEFWQRWHMSLSFWLRDYVLGPLVGDGSTPVTRFRFAWATMLTFVLIGFWHGASWNFVLFGFFHGFFVIAYGLAIRRVPDWAAKMPGGSQLATVFHLVVVGLVGSMLFREQHVGRIVEHLTRNPLAGSLEEWVAAVVVMSVTAFMTAPLLMGWLWDRYVRARVEMTVWHLPIQTTAWAGYVAVMSVFYRVSAQDFVYFQF
jgi:D-alanyl-lipoteichoic acid acyltransferase DltB (MBOAT superfamily)